jgi:hypothetical protein
MEVVSMIMCPTCFKKLEDTNARLSVEKLEQRAWRCEVPKCHDRRIGHRVARRVRVIKAAPPVEPPEQV